jgi:hypothetical protein
VPSDSRRTGHERVTGGSSQTDTLLSWTATTAAQSGPIFCLQQVQYGTEANLARRVVTAARDAAARAD